MSVEGDESMSKHGDADESKSDDAEPVVPVHDALEAESGTPARGTRMNDDGSRETFLLTPTGDSRPTVPRTDVRGSLLRAWAPQPNVHALSVAPATARDDGHWRLCRECRRVRRLLPPHARGKCVKMGTGDFSCRECWRMQAAPAAACVLLCARRTILFK